MPPWNAHDILLRFTNPPVTDDNGFLQADRHGVIDRWDIVNAIEHAPWTTKQLYAMRAAEKNARARQFGAFNGWNNSYSYDPNDQHSITESDLWAKHRGYWYHHDGRPFIPIQKQFDRAVRLGNAVAKPIASLLRRARSYSALPKVPAKDDSDDEEYDLPTPVPQRRLRRRATISRMSDNFEGQGDPFDDVLRTNLAPPDQTERDRRPSSRGPAWHRPSPYVHGLACRCWNCEETRQFMCGRYRIPQDGSYDKHKGTGVDNYSETWDEWNNRADFIRKSTRAPIDTLDLRHRSRPKRPQTGQPPTAPVRQHGPSAQFPAEEPRRPESTGSRHSRYEQAMPPHINQAGPSRRQAIPSAPVVPDHVASHFQTAGLLNDEQKYWAQQRADWKAARLQELRDLERRHDQPSGGPIDDWRRAVDIPPPHEDGGKGKERASRPEKAKDPARRHRHEAPTAPKPKVDSVTAPPAKSKSQVPPPAPVLSRQTQDPSQSKTCSASRPPPPAVLMQMDAMKRQKHAGLARNQTCEDDDSDPFDERNFDRARVTHVYRQAERATDPNPAPIHDALPPRAPGRSTRAERDARIAYLARDHPWTSEERAQKRLELAQLAEMRARERGRKDMPSGYYKGGVTDPIAEAELRRRLGQSSGPTALQCDYVVDRLQDFLDTRAIPSSHTPAFPPARPRTRDVPGVARKPPPAPHAPDARASRPSRDIDPRRPSASRIEKALPSLPSFPTLASTGNSGPSRAHHQPPRHVRDTHVQTPPEDPPIRQGRRGAYESDQTNYSDGDDNPDDCPRAGDSGWRDAYANAQLKAKKQELKKVLEEYEEMEAARIRRERKKR